MESVNIANNYKKAFEEYEQESPLLMQSVIWGESLHSDRPNRFFRGLIFALPIAILMWVIIIWAFLSFL